VVGHTHHADPGVLWVSVKNCSTGPLRGEPIAVGCGVLVTTSYEAIVFGIVGGMAGSRVREYCLPLISFHVERIALQYPEIGA
jgi:hypothetical protein